MRSLRERTKQIPVVGPLLYNYYLKTFYDEGKVMTIKEGLLAGKSWIRFMRTSMDGYITGNYEVSIQMALAKHLSPGMVFYDVGANGGFFSLLGASLVGPSGRVVAFEPHPTTASQLEKQMRVNGLNNVDTVVAAVSDAVGVAVFSDDTSSDTLSLVDAHKAARTIRVATTTLDHETKTHRLPDLLKIDVEGAEIEVLRGGRNLFTTKRPALLVEVHSDEIAVRYDALMIEFGYTTQNLMGKPISVAESRERFVLSLPT